MEFRYAGNVDKARKILSKAKQEAKHEWKVFLESVLLEMRANSIKKIFFIYLFFIIYIFDVGNTFMVPLKLPKRL